MGIPRYLSVLPGLPTLLSNLTFFIIFFYFRSPLLLITKLITKLLYLSPNSYFLKAFRPSLMLVGPQVL
jgi:hypothetical protein